MWNPEKDEGGEEVDHETACTLGASALSTVLIAIDEWT